MNSYRPPSTAILIVSVAAIVACILRCVFAQSEFVWLDELHTSWTVSETFSDVFGRAADGNQSPLYFWLTWLSVSVFGHSEWSLRLVSIIAGISTLLAASLLTWRWTHSAIAAGLVGCLIAVDVPFVYYGSEARPYALLELLSVIQVSLFCEALWSRESTELSDPDREVQSSIFPFWSLALVTILLIYTHVTCVWLLVTEIAFLLILGLIEMSSRSNSNQSAPRRNVIRWITTALLTFVASMPVIIQAAVVYERRGNWQNISSIAELWPQVWPVMISLIGLPIIVLMIRSGLGKGNRPSNGSNARMVFVLLWALIPFACVFGVDYLKIAPMALLRYTLVGAVGFPVFAGLCVGRLSTRPGKIGLAAIIVLASQFQNPMIESVLRKQPLPQFKLEDWRPPISEINLERSKSHQPVFLFANLIEDCDALTNSEPRFQNYLLFPVNALYPLEVTGEVSAGPTLAYSHFSDDQINSIKQQGGCWAIVRGSADIVEEISQEIQVRTALALGKQPDDIQISILVTVDSPVYLISADW